MKIVLKLGGVKQTPSLPQNKPEELAHDSSLAHSDSIILSEDEGGESQDEDPDDISYVKS